MEIKEYLFLKSIFDKENELSDMILCGVDMKDAVRNYILSQKMMKFPDGHSAEEKIYKKRYNEYISMLKKKFKTIYNEDVIKK